MDVNAVLAGTGQPQQITRGMRMDWRPSWSPDGGRVVYASGHEGSMDIFAIDPLGAGAPVNLTHQPVGFNSWAAAFSPDGGRLLVSAHGHAATPAWVGVSLAWPRSCCKPAC